MQLHRRDRAAGCLCTCVRCHGAARARTEARTAAECAGWRLARAGQRTVHSDDGKLGPFHKRGWPCDVFSRRWVWTAQDAERIMR